MPPNRARPVCSVHLILRKLLAAAQTRQPYRGYGTSPHRIVARPPVRPSFDTSSHRHKVLALCSPIGYRWPSRLRRSCSHPRPIRQVCATVAQETLFSRQGPKLAPSHRAAVRLRGPCMQPWAGAHPLFPAYGCNWVQPFVAGDEGSLLYVVRQNLAGVVMVLLCGTQRCDVTRASTWP